MIFEWDEKKNRANQLKHGLSFETAVQVFEDPYALMFPERVVEDEERWHAIGRAGGIAILLVVYSITEDDDEEKVRIISARKANRRERALYPTHH
jgi:uncharacterized DUF497 family protein